MGFYVIDIINLIILFLLFDFFNGIHGNYLGKKFKSSVFAVIVFSLADLIVCCLVSFSMITKSALLFVEIIIIVVVIVIRLNIEKMMNYKDVEAGKEVFFGKQKVMFLVPHEDDDINLAGGVIEEYLKHGSDVYVVFATNGDGDENHDLSKIGYIRINEAIQALTFLGVPENNIIFLGYGNGWDKTGPHIYNAPMDVVIYSRAGKYRTYSIDSHPAYREGRDYTFSNLYDDIRQVILDYKPDVLYCIDYDTHIDHRALSMLFEKVMGDILRCTDYHPTVYKGYGYRTAWGAPNDFLADINILSTVDSHYPNDVLLYDWNTRVRLSIDIQSISRKLQFSKIYKSLCLYASQSAKKCAGSIINGDKVYWKRRTDSLLYKAKITVSSGDKDKLTDFMLLDCKDILYRGNFPFDGVWHPDSDDSEKRIQIVFDSATYIDCLVLYDSPSATDNIINANIILDDGTCIKTGKLKVEGLEISIKKSVNSLRIEIDEYEGDGFGLSEVEAYGKPDQNKLMLYKITDMYDNFVYDYIVHDDSELNFKVYNSGNHVLNNNEFYVTCDNKHCCATIQDDKILVKCPKGKKCMITLFSKDNQICDRVLVRNLNSLEQRVFSCVQTATIKKTFIHRVFNKWRTSQKIIKH